MGENGRLGHTEKVLSTFAEIMDADKGKVEATVTTAKVRRNASFDSPASCISRCACCLLPRWFHFYWIMVSDLTAGFHFHPMMVPEYPS